MPQPTGGSYASSMCATYLTTELALPLMEKYPYFAFTGITPDISIILLFTFYQPVFYATYDQHFPSEMKRGLATGLDLGSIVEMQ